MAGIYVHIPFCKKKCHYCDFYKTTDTELSDKFIQSLKKEISLQNSYLGNGEIQTIYFGGGTPSSLNTTQLADIIKHIGDSFNIISDAEITIEVNPDDTSAKYYKAVAGMGFNRISLGVQSWDNETLRLLNRRHNSAQAEKSIIDALSAGFDNISIDLIYGIPGMTDKQWQKDLVKTFRFDIKHLSAYHLTFEKETVFDKMKNEGLLSEPGEEESEKQFNSLIELSEKNGFVQYEISNLCREGYYSKHNSNYWRQEKYLGLGPSAHSYNTYSRQWNVSDIAEYIASLEKDELPSSVEILDTKQKYNEYVMTALRTMWGLDLDLAERHFGKELRDYLFNMSARFIEYGMIEKKDSKNLILTNQGKMISDNIIAGLMID